MYWIKTPWIFKKIFKNYTWNKSAGAKKVYLTFDDGPIPEITEWVIGTLNKYNVKATFFCVGENIQKHPQIFEQLLSNNHCVGNHTYNHNNGWETDDKVYLESVIKTQKLLAQKLTDYHTELTTKIFRPPYGKLTPNQSTQVRENGFEVIMWDVLSADFDPSVTARTCLRNVIKNTEDGSIVVFHDNIKSFKTIQYVLPRYLKYLRKKGYRLDIIC